MAACNYEKLNMNCLRVRFCWLSIELEATHDNFLYKASRNIPAEMMPEIRKCQSHPHLQVVQFISCLPEVVDRRSGVKCQSGNQKLLIKNTTQQVQLTCIKFNHIPTVDGIVNLTRSK